jgi:hypothetical protein
VRQLAAGRAGARCFIRTILSMWRVSGYDRSTIVAHDRRRQTALRAVGLLQKVDRSSTATAGGLQQLARAWSSWRGRVIASVGDDRRSMGESGG